MEEWDKLVEEYPELFEGPFYFECNLGWYGIISSLLRTISHFKERYPESFGADFAVVQVKEKFGGLRFYTVGACPKECLGAIQLAELLSVQICEVCGSPGEKRSGAWVSTLCDTHKR